MFFWVKKLIGYVIMPVPLCVILIGVGALLLWRRNTQRAGRILVTTGLALLVLLGNKFVSAHLLRPLENRHPPVPELSAEALPPALAECKYVVVLGGGNGFSPGVAAINLLSPSARARIVEAVRLLHRLPDAQLLVSGPGGRKAATHATVLERAAVSLGIAPERIIRIEHARDTEDEANAVKQHAGNARVALVTSAWHMPRSVALFTSAGIDVLPCPTDYKAHDDGGYHWRDLLWDVDSLERSSLAIRERVGYLWIKLRGKTQAGFATTPGRN